MRLAVLLLVLTAPPVQANLLPADLLLAARCIGEVEALWADPPDHIVLDPRRSANLAYAFETIATLRESPPMAEMQAARKEGMAKAQEPPNDFSSVEDIMEDLKPDDDCLRIIDRLGLLPVVYPQCVPRGCP